MIPGFRFEERMAGSYHLLSAPSDERTIELTMMAESPSIARFLRKPVAMLQGEADLEGFADHKPAHGTMLIAPIGRGIIGYDFEFRGNDCQQYRFRGQKNVELFRLVETMARLPAGIFSVASGREVGRAVVRFHYQDDLLRFLRSWRLA